MCAIQNKSQGQTTSSQQQAVQTERNTIFSGTSSVQGNSRFVKPTMFVRTSRNGRFSDFRKVNYNSGYISSRIFSSQFHSNFRSHQFRNSGYKAMIQQPVVNSSDSVTDTSIVQSDSFQVSNNVQVMSLSLDGRSTNEHLQSQHQSTVSV